ncbi:hypothetical protein K2224_05810 [Streptomyces sp. BHT-5-2]|uniref:hypothetical protein n=1 Tax=Streptomyces sp. BHT-5-2 TaxID=2866715 RepID=UPI001C8EAEA5|nr:hypothetical protein [Streptomyces sp. BHT-5-2]QZL02792.1 hypothetical protein K2224_05810 [Streptomyces sp. BHT-5-2]
MAARRQGAGGAWRLSSLQRARPRGRGKPGNHAIPLQGHPEPPGPHTTARPAKSGYGLGPFVQKTGPNCGGTRCTHDGHVQGHATLMYSPPDGSRTLDASFTYAEDAARSQAQAYQKAVQTRVTGIEPAL